MIPSEPTSKKQTWQARLLDRARWGMAGALTVAALAGGTAFWAGEVDASIKKSLASGDACDGLEVSDAYRQIERRQRLAAHYAEKYKRDPLHVRRVVDLAWQAAENEPGISPEFVLAIIDKESGFDPRARSSMGARGLMQVLPRFHPEKIAPGESLYDPSVNVRVGVQILSEYLDRANDNPHRALARYSGGARGYARDVLAEKRRLERLAAI